MNPKVVLLWRAVLSLAISGAAAFQIPASAASHTVTVSGFSFSPRVITINPGDTVTWTGLANFHTVTGSNQVVEPFCGTASQASCTRTFNTSGTFGYFCSPHNGLGMNGQVIVRTNNLPPTVSIITPTDGAVFPHGQPVPMNVTVSDPEGGAIAKVRYTANGAVIAEPTGPFFISPLLPPGPVTLIAIAFDVPGAMGTSAPVNITVTHPPIQITSLQRIQAGGTQAIAFNASGTVSGSKYVLETTSLMRPGANFTPLRTNTAGANGLPVSEEISLLTNRFFRLRFQP